MVFGGMTMLSRSDTTMTQFLLNIREHLDKDWDFFLVVEGSTGKGKSILCLQIIEHWYNVILKEPMPKDVIKQITGDIVSWCTNLMTLNNYDINVYDEGLLSMDSRDHGTKVQKEVKKIFNTVRSSKRLLNVIIVQDWFSLTKYFRQHRASSLISLHARGIYHLFTKKDIGWINGKNERLPVKTLKVAMPFHFTSFPDYKGWLRDEYYEMINKLKREEIKNSLEIIKIDKQGKIELADVYRDDVKRLVDMGYTHKNIRSELGISGSVLTKCLYIAKKSE